jgi:hypothetical protein
MKLSLTVLLAFLVIHLAEIPCARAQQGPLATVPSEKSMPDGFDGLMEHLSFSKASKSVTFSISMGGPQALHRSAEYFRNSSLSRTYTQSLGIEPSWKYRAVPITVSYVYTLPNLSERIAPVVGAGLSAHLYRLTLHDSPALTGGSDAASYEYGAGYGVEASMGLQMALTRNIFALSQVRYRYVRCFSEVSIDRYNSQFSMVDFVVGLGFTF